MGKSSRVESQGCQVESSHKVVMSSRVASRRVESRLSSRVKSQAFQVESQVISQVYIFKSETSLPKVNVKEYHAD